MNSVCVSENLNRIQLFMTVSCFIFYTASVLCFNKIWFEIAVAKNAILNYSNLLFIWCIRTGNLRNKKTELFRFEKLFSIQLGKKKAGMKAFHQLSHKLREGLPCCVIMACWKYFSNQSPSAFLKSQNLRLRLFSINYVSMQTFH